MTISDQQLRAAVRGAVEIQEENGFYSLFRFTTEQKTDFEGGRHQKRVDMINGEFND